MNQDSFNNGNEKNNSSNRYILWNAPLLNHFQGDLLFDIHEIEDKLFVRYEQSTHPAANAIKQLLKSTSQFLYQTTLETSSAQSSMECKTDGDWQKVFNNITQELNKAQTQCNDEIKNSKGYLVLEAAIKYCKNCIALQLHVIEKSPNIIHTKYTNYGSELKNIMSAPSSVNLKH